MMKHCLMGAIVATVAAATAAGPAVAGKATLNLVLVLDVNDDEARDLEAVIEQQYVQMANTLRLI